MALAFRVLGWRPRDFWAASPRELAAALDRLIAAFPDREPAAPGCP